MLIITTENIAGKNLEALGLVTGSIVQSKHFGKDLMAGLKTLVGGEIKGYTEMMAEARKIATERLEKAAGALDADAVVGLRYTSSAVMDGAAEVTAYGTAVKFR